MHGNQINFICLISFYTQIDERVEQPFSGLFFSPYVYLQLFNCIFHVEDLSSQNQEDRNNVILDSCECLRPVISHCYHAQNVAFVWIKTTHGIGVLGCRAVFLVLPVVVGTGEMSNFGGPVVFVWSSIELPPALQGVSVYHISHSREVNPDGTGKISHCH